MRTVVIDHKNGTRTYVSLDTDSPFTKHSLSVGKNGYVSLRLEGTIQYLHRAIMGLKRGDKRQVHHIDCNKKNNVKANLKVVTQTVNLRCKGPAKTNKAGLKGVVKTRNGRYQASIGCKIGEVSTRKCLGTFATAHEAGLAYDQAALSRFGETFLNFPDEVPNILSVV